MSEQLNADDVLHVQVETPNWDTKVRCSCGDDFTSRCEFYKHGYEALLALFRADQWLDSEEGQASMERVRERLFGPTQIDGEVS